MFLFSKPTSILFLGRDSLAFSSSSLQHPLKLTYPKDVMEFGVIQNDEGFTSVTKEFLKSIKSRERPILLLSDDLVYVKTVDNKDRPHLGKIAKEFLEKVPVEDHSIGKGIAETKSGVMLFIIDKRLPEELIAVCKSSGWNIPHIVPSVLTGIDASKLSDTKEAVETILATLHLHPKCDFKKVM